jgi:hypothetical protein
MEPALPAVAGTKGSARREGFLVAALVAAAVVSALAFDAAVHPERVHDPRHHARFALDREALPALGAVRVRSDAPLNQIAAFGRVDGLAPGVTGPFQRARYLRASVAETADAVAALGRGEAPSPPPMPDLARYFADAQGPYRCDLQLATGKTVADVREKLPSARLSGEPVAREAEDEEARAVTRSLLLGMTVMALWLAWRCGLKEAERRLLAAVGALSVTGLLGAGADRWTLPALLLVAGAPRGAPLLAAAPCLLFPSLALERLGLVLCLGGGFRLLLRRPALPRLPGRRSAVRAAALAASLGLLGFLLLRATPPLAPPRAEVAAEPSAFFVTPDHAPEAATALRALGLEVTGDEPLLPGPPEPAKRRNLWKIFTRARTLANRSEGEARERFEDVSDAASQVSLPTLPRELRSRLQTRDGRAVLWVTAGADRPEFTSARLYRARGEIQLREGARLAGLLVTVTVVLVVAAFSGVARAVVVFLGTAAAAALLLVADPAEADFYLPLLPLAAAAPAVGPALALAAAAIFLPAHLWPAAAFFLAASAGGYGSIRHRPAADVAGG